MFSSFSVACRKDGPVKSTLSVIPDLIRNLLQIVIHNMRIYAAADLHGKHRYITVIQNGIQQCRAHAVVLAGDILNYRRNPDLLQSLDKLPVPVFLIRGNSDPTHLEQWSSGSRNLRSLHMTAIPFGGFDFVGISGTLPLPFHSVVGWRESRMLGRLAPMIHPRSILVTHPPPRGRLDRVLGRFHAGSRGVARVVRETVPAVMICGHIHEAAGVDRIGNTLIVNCALGAGRKGAKVVIGDGQTPSAEML